jgi:hypothetical protein
LARAGIHELSSIGVHIRDDGCRGGRLYLGIDRPAATKLEYISATWQRAISKADPVETRSALGTFIASITALLSVYYIIVDVDARHLWSIVIGVGWLSRVDDANRRRLDRSLR